MKLRLLALMITALASAPALAGLKADVVPILNQRCVMCHLPGATQAGLDLFTNPWASLVSVKSTQSQSLLVAPGEPEQSYLYLKLVGRHLEAGGQGEPMPIPPAVLTPQELEAIHNWIAEGAPDD